MKRPRVSVRGMIIAIALIGVILGAVRLGYHSLVRHTEYAPGLRLGRFDDRLIGMSRAEVAATHGAPLLVYKCDSRRAVQDRSDPRFSDGIRRDVARIGGRTVPKFVYRTTPSGEFLAWEEWVYSTKAGGSSYRRLVVNFDLVSGEVDSVTDMIYFD